MKFHLLLALLCATILQATEPSTFNELFHQGNSCFKEAKFEEAITWYTKALALDAKHPQLFFNLGLCFAHTKQFEQAKKHYLQALEVDASYAKPHYYLAQLYFEHDQFDNALHHYKRTLDLQRSNTDALLGLARTLCKLNKFEESITLFEEVLQRRPRDTSIMLDFANTLNMHNHIHRALELYETILELLPNNPSILYNIAYTHKKLGDVQKAIPIYHRVLELQPSNAEAHFGLGLSYLLLGDFEHGWQEYEWRWKRKDGSTSQRSFDKPVWDGSDLHGKTILLHAEQGLGDTLEFVRYAQVAKERGGTVIVATQNPLVTLLQQCPYIDSVIPLNAKVPEFDVHAALVSMPLIAKTTVDTVPNVLPYLYADPDLVALWKRKLAHDKKFKVGICWQGNPNYSTHFLRVAVAAKSMHVNTFAPLAQIDGVSIYSLQRETGTNQEPTFVVHTFDADFDKEHGRFMDTAAVMKNLDLIITIDTSTCHLAGGLGVPTWLLLPNPPDWRWMLNTDKTPWYPHMRLFRQPEPDDWDTVIQTVKHELEKVVAARKNA